MDAGGADCSGGTNIGLVDMPTLLKASLIQRVEFSEPFRGKSRLLNSFGQRSFRSSAFETGYSRTVAANLSNSDVGAARMKLVMKVAKPCGVRAARLGGSKGALDLDIK
jgi:hypothetical protein